MDANSNHPVWPALTSLAALVAVWLHFFQIESLPRGFFFDESSIGYNAYRITTSGVDEHGKPWPLFFKAFGEYKNPLYIYLTALGYKLFGFSPWTTRATSALCWLGGTLFLMLLGYRMFKDPRTRLYLLLCASFTPWLFSLSRVSFELIALYPLLTLHLWAVYRAYQEGSKGWAFIAGISAGLTVYAYSTFRLLAPVHVAAVLLCYAGRPHRRSHVPFLAGAAIAVLPYMVYARENFSTLTLRFNSLTFLYDPALPKLAKLGMFWDRYVSYLGPEFLVLSGDPNRRHHSGYGGELFVVTGLLLILGVAAKLKTGELWKQPFNRFLLAGLLIAPVAASLTLETHHSLRSFSMAVFAILLSATGMEVLSQRPGRRLASIMLAALAVNGLLYVHHYFTRFPQVSVTAFENFGFKEALEMAAGKAKGKVVLSPGGDWPYIDVLFFCHFIDNPRGVVVRIGGRSEVNPGDAFVKFDPTRRLAHSRAGLPEGSLYGWLPYEQLRHPGRSRRAAQRLRQDLGPTASAPSSSLHQGMRSGGRRGAGGAQATSVCAIRQAR
ncbi:MAG TPA: glycosyltransferase family 39 protein [Thermoanaerobaculia bacterium]